MEDFETWWREEIDKCLTPPTPERMAKLAVKSPIDSILEAPASVVTQPGGLRIVAGGRID